MSWHAGSSILRTVRARVFDDFLWPPWLNGWTISSGLILVTLMVGIVKQPAPLPHYRVAFIGNSMQYYNDLPRFMEAISDDRISQNSCLHGDATLKSILSTGNGMYTKFDTDTARIDFNINDDNDTYVEDSNTTELFDYGACTVPQLLFGRDDELEKQVQQILQQKGQQQEDAGNDDESENQGEQKQEEDTYLYDDGYNPCLQDPEYFEYLEWQQQSSTTAAASFDFVVLNDNTRSPARTLGRAAGLEVLERVYIPWFEKLNVTPIFLHTHAYWTEWRDLSGLLDVPTFTSFTYGGYLAYVNLVNSYLKGSTHKQARIAPAGMAFLIIWEENYSMWEKLFHSDQVHASPYGTYLEGCILHTTIFGKLPDPELVLPQYSLEHLWSRARRMQPPSTPNNTIPTPEEAAYLYHICQRVMVYHHVPKSFFVTTASANYTPEDWLYVNNRW